MARGRDIPGPAAPPGEAIRLDRWLCHARVFKTRTLAADRIAAGGVRLNGQPCRKPGQVVRPGDVIMAATFGKVRVLRVISAGERRGPATEARLLYEDLTDPPDGCSAEAGEPEDGGDPGAAADA